MDELLDNGGPEQQNPTPAEAVLQTAQLLYPVVLLLAFIISAGVHTVITSRTEEELVVPTVKGPDGKPLPITKRKRERDALETDDDACSHRGFAWSLFLYLTGGLTLSFVANGAAVAAHAMQSSRSAGLDAAWWCGEERIVSAAPPLPSL